MKVCVQGLWHLGTVTAACLAAAGHDVVGLDDDQAVVDGLRAGHPPVAEPGLDDLLTRESARRRLSFTTDSHAALAGAAVVWIAFDTPVDQRDRADVRSVVDRVERIFPDIPDGALVLISSQLPVGSTRSLEAAFAAAHPGRQVSFAYSPENLRLGQAIRIFCQPDRAVVGVRSVADRERVAALLAPIIDRIEWMSVESAEMTKHALNSFLATSVAFMNEIATLCELTGADAREVERGLKTEERIGPKAYLRPGAAFAGGTLARDISFLTDLAKGTGHRVDILPAVRRSNQRHKWWAAQRLQARLGNLAGRRIAVWGLTYKPGTNTLRRSSAVELCRWLLKEGARVQAHDPAIEALPGGLGGVTLCPSAGATLAGADALVVATEWPEYREVSPDLVRTGLRTLLVLDANGFLAATFGAVEGLRYDTVGRASA